MLGNFRRFVAINSALEVDLTGQVNAETAQGRHIGLTGGQMDFVRAANRAPEGRSIIALQSTSRDRTPFAHRRAACRTGSSRRRAPTPIASSPSTASPNCSGRTLAERARALIAIADPAFRAELRLASERLL